MRHANISIATGLTHNPAQSLLAICDYVVFNEHALCRQLKQLCGEHSNQKSVVISCAGIGSRLGLGLTKALVQINGSSLISWQLKLFKDVEDLRLVIGFQGSEIIEEVRKYRDDVIFCYNQRYFETKTGASYYLGTLLLMEGLRTYNFIIPRPKQIIKREMPEMQGKTSSFPLTSCPEHAGQGGGLIVDAERDYSSCCLENFSSQSTEPFTNFCSVDRTIRNPVSGSVWVSPIPRFQ